MAQDHFHYLDIKWKVDAFIILGDIIITLLLLYYANVGYYRAKQYTFVSTQVKIIFIMIFCWGLSYVFQFAYGIGVYLSFPNPIDTPNIYSQIYASLDAFPAFIIQGLFIIIPFNILTNIYELMDQQYYDYKISSRELKFYKFVKLYQKVRYFKLIQSIVVLFPLSVTGLRIACIFGITSNILDIIICFVIIVVSRRIIFSKDSITQKMKIQQINQLKNQLLFLQVINLIRLIFDLILWYPIVFQVIKPDQINTYGYLLFGQIAVHLLPMYFIIKLHVVPIKNDGLLTRDSLN